MLIDPGPPSDLTVLIEKVKKIIGSIKNINLIFINHQDPDVAYNAASIQKVNPSAFILASEDTFRLINFYGIDKTKTKAVENFKDYVKNFLDKTQLDDVLKGFNDLSFTSIFNIDSNGIKDIKVDPDTALEFLAKNIRILLPKDKIEYFDIELIKILLKWNVTVPKIFDVVEKEQINLFLGGIK